MTPLDRIRNALPDFESIEAHGGHMPGMLPETFSVEDLRKVVEMAGESERLREAVGEMTSRAREAWLWFSRNSSVWRVA